MFSIYLFNSFYPVTAARVCMAAFYVRPTGGKLGAAAALIQVFNPAAISARYIGLY
jgi:hypothetical protein